MAARFLPAYSQIRTRNLRFLLTRLVCSILRILGEKIGASGLTPLLPGPSSPCSNAARYLQRRTVKTKPSFRCKMQLRSGQTRKMAKRKSNSGKKLAKRATLGSSTSSGKQSAVGFDFEPTDQKIPKEEEPGPSTSTPSAAEDPRPSANLQHQTVRETVDRTLPSLTHQTSTLLNWSLLEQLRLNNELGVAIHQTLRLQTLMQIHALEERSVHDASYFMNLLQSISHVKAPDHIIGPNATAKWSRLSSPNQYLMEAAAGLRFAHQRFPNVQLNDVSDPFTEAELEMIDRIEAQVQEDPTGEVQGDSEETEETSSQEPILTTKHEV
ncbi:hypothetical protein PaG_04179 [Moesziomyces aphidis]|uniref:Uncharacterized protein n=1 Tax=Moesziomyces aphidis TaxID=84754 RepID=W3VJI4_MOEAP|nr:hypothetical protein PaG_04179 [Moesziomyces aphidis]